MGRHPELIEAGENQLRNAVVEHTFAIDDGFLGRVEGGRIILIMNDDRAGLRTLIEDLGLAFIDARPLGVHLHYPHPAIL
jgi:hypothetical protein